MAITKLVRLRPGLILAACGRKKPKKLHSRNPCVAATVVQTNVAMVNLGQISAEKCERLFQSLESQIVVVFQTNYCRQMINMTGIWIFLFELRYLKVREKKWQRTRLNKPIYQKYPIYEAQNAAIEVSDLNLTDFIRFPEFQFSSEHSHVQSLRSFHARFG